MDQVKQVLAVLNAQKFWVTSGVLALLPIGIWFMAKSTLDKQRQDNEGKIVSAFKTAEGIRGNTDHPNEKTHQGMDENVELVKRSVEEAWREQYEKQQAVLLWPSGPGELEADFIEKVTSSEFRPFEKLPYGSGGPEALRRDFREEYRDYIKRELPKLAAIIGASWQAKAVSSGEGAMGAAGMMGGGGGPPGGMTMGSPQGTSAVVDNSVVAWNSSDQTDLQARFDWSSKPGKVPNTLDVLYAQEDLWVLNAVMNIIKRTNGRATANYNATIKELQYIRLGKAVPPTTGQITRLQKGSSSADMMGEGGAAAMMSNAAAMMSSQGSGGGAEASSDGAAGASGAMASGAGGSGGDPVEMRYVGMDYEPLSASRVRSALTSESPSDAFLVVAKRIPIRIGVKMDQRHVHRLVTECGNSTLMVEVRQVRVNKQTAGGGGGGGGGFGGFGMPSGGGGGGESGGLMGGFGMMGSSQFGGGNRNQAASGSGYDLPIELYGIVYIYNPVIDKLNVEKLEAGDEEAGAAPVEAAADATDAVPNETAESTEGVDVAAE